MRMLIKKGWFCMEQPKEDIGTKKDLVLYRLQTARSDLKSAKILLAPEEYKGVNNRAYYALLCDKCCSCSRWKGLQAS